jgi:hypothetical protein
MIEGIIIRLFLNFRYDFLNISLFSSIRLLFMYILQNFDINWDLIDIIMIVLIGLWNHFACNLIALALNINIRIWSCIFLIYRFDFMLDRKDDNFSSNFYVKTFKLFFVKFWYMFNNQSNNQICLFQLFDHLFNQRNLCSPKTEPCMLQKIMPTALNPSSFF